MTPETEYEEQHREAPKEEIHGRSILLRVWQEVVGTLQHVSLKDPSLDIRLKAGHEIIRLALQLESIDAEHAGEFLAGCKTGSIIGVLRTDSRVRPIMLRKIRE